MRSPPRSASSVSRSNAEIADGQQSLRRSNVGAAEQRLQAHVELGQRERLDQIVVGAGFEAFDLVGQQIFRREHQHGHARVACLAQLAAQR